MIFESQAKDSEDKPVGSFSSGGLFYLFPIWEHFWSFGGGSRESPNSLMLLQGVLKIFISVDGSKYLGCSEFLGCSGGDQASVTHDSPKNKETITFKYYLPLSW